MELLYIDESGNTGTDYTNKHQPYFVMAGICVKDENWHKINDNFEKEKKVICPEFEFCEIHASELFNAPKSSIFNKYSWKDNLKTLEKIVNLIINYDITLIYTVIDKKEFKKVTSSNIKIDPYLLGYSATYAMFDFGLKKRNNYGIIFCDEINSISKDLELIYPKLTKNSNKIIEKALYTDSKKNNFIQMADICALYINKHFCMTKGNISYNDIKAQHCTNMYKKIMTLSKECNDIQKKFAYMKILDVFEL